jgi:hypothetical protein
LLLFCLLLRLTPVQFRPRGVDMVVHVDANGLGHDRRNARISLIVRRIQQCGPGAVARRRHRSQPSGILVAKDWDSYSTHDSW